MEAKTIAVENGVNFIQTDSGITAHPMDLDNQGFHLPQVLKAAKAAGLPLKGWKESGFIHAFYLTRGA